MDQQSRLKLKGFAIMFLSSSLMGGIGAFARYIEAPGLFISFCRNFAGLLGMTAIYIVARRFVKFKGFRVTPMIVLSGIFLGRRVLCFLWRMGDEVFSKPEARTLINLAWMTLSALPMGGTATVTARREDGRVLLIGSAEGARARLKAEAVVGLRGERLTEGLAGQWIQPYWLWLTVRDAGGRLDLATEEGRVGLVARMPIHTTA